MKTVLPTLPLLGLSLVAIFSTSAHAGGTDLLSIDNTLSKLQGQTFYLGTDATENGKLLGLYFKNTFRVPNPCTGKTPAAVEHFTLAQLRNPNIVVTSTKLPMDCQAPVVYDVVRMQLEGETLTVGYKPDVRHDEWKSQTYNLACDSKSNCRVTDNETHEVVSHLLARAHRFAHFVDTGIEHLDSGKAALDN